MATVDQVPSEWAVKVTLQDDAGMSHTLWWDYVIDNFFAYQKGVFLIWLNAEGIHERIAYAPRYPDNHPALGGEEAMLRCVKDCVKAFNAEIKARFFSEPGADPHPVSEPDYQYLTQHLLWDSVNQRFETDAD